MARFSQLASVKALKALAEHPIDLSKEGVLTAQRINTFQAHADGYKLLYGTERVTSEVLTHLIALAQEQEVVDKMEAMQRGEVINTIEGYESENRRVLHTAMRDLFDNPQHAAPAKEATALAQKELEKLATFLDRLDQHNQFNTLVQVGIGGSDLGPRALFLALKAYKRADREVHFISNVDPDDAATVLKGLDLKRTLVLVVSKSGSTLETLTNETLVASYFKKAGLKPEDHFLAVTGEGSPLDNPQKYLASFYMWDFIGGRYSATSMVGCVMLGFALGMPRLRELLKGAHTMDQIALQRDVHTNLPLLSALLGVWNRNFLGHHTVAIIPYSQALVRFTAHLQQCDMESNGKHIDKKGHPVDFDTGPIIWGEPGTNGQHSFYQMIHQGTTPLPLEFVGFKKSQYGIDLAVQGTTSQEKLLANLFAQSIALATGQKNSNPNKQFAGNRPNRILLGEQLTPYALGALLSYYENKVAFQGFLWNINSFDQEGVQLGKVLANKILAIQAGTAPEDSFELGAALLRQ